MVKVGDENANPTAPRRLERSVSLASLHSSNRYQLAMIVCPQRYILYWLTREQRRSAFQAVNSTLWSAVITVFTFASLYANDFSTIANGGYGDTSGLVVVLMVCFGAFTADLILRSTFDVKYVFSFYFWLDLVSTVSLGLEFMLDSEATSGVLLARTARATRAGARLPRLIRLMKLIRMLRVLKLWRTVSDGLSGKRRFVDYHDDSEEGDSLDESPGLRMVTEQLTVIISRKVVIGVLIIVACYSLLEPTVDDLGPHVGMAIIHGLGSRGPEFKSALQNAVEVIADAYAGEVVQVATPKQQFSFVDLPSSRLCALNTSELATAAAAGNGDFDAQDFSEYGAFSSGFQPECPAAASFMDISFARETEEKAWSGVAQTSMLVMFVLGWAYMMQHDIQHYLVSPLLRDRINKKHRKSLAPGRGNKDERGLRMRSRRTLGNISGGGGGGSGGVNNDMSAGDGKESNIVDEALELILLNAQDRSAPANTRNQIAAVLDEVGTSNMRKLVTCLRNLRTSLVQERAIQHALDGVISAVTRETEYTSTLYNPIVDHILKSEEFRNTNAEVRRWVYRKMLPVPHSTFVELTSGARKKLGVEFVEDVRQEKDTTALGDFNFKSTFAEDSAIAKALGGELAVLNSLSRKLEAFDFDVLELGKVTDEQPLLWVAYTVMVKHNLHHKFNIEEATLTRFLETVETGDWIQNPYHNNYQSADIIRTLHWMLTSQRMADQITELDSLAFILSGVIINYQHSGRTNEFEIATGSQLGVFFDQDHVLERYSLAAAFTLMNHHKVGILRSMDAGVWRALHNTVTQLVLSRSLRSHFGLVEKTSMISSPAPGTVIQKEEDRLLFMQVALNVADVSYTFKAKRLHIIWVERLFTEMFEMGDEEKKNELAITPFCDRERTQIGHAQVAFFDYVAKPMISALNDFLAYEPEAHLFNNLDTNYIFWAKRMNKEQGRKTNSGVPTYTGFHGRSMLGPLAKRLSTKKPVVALESEEDLSTVDKMRNSTRFSRQASLTTGVRTMSKHSVANAMAQEVQDMLHKVQPFDIHTAPSRASVERANSMCMLYDNALHVGAHATPSTLKSPKTPKVSRNPRPHF